jgi:hypothetical protein
MSSNLSSARSALLLVGMLLGLGACVAREGAINDPLQRNFQWFSFVGGDDIRARCVAGAPDRYRFVLNAVWEEQVRVYELERLPPGQGALLKVNVIRGAPHLLQAYLIDSNAAGSASWQSRLGEQQYRDIVSALERAGFARTPPDGTRLQSYDFYWLVNACTNGRWHLNAWRRQDPGFDRLGFDRLLFGHDSTGVAVNPTRAIDPAQRLLQYGDAPSERGRAASTSFELMIRRGRLFGHGARF